MLLQRTEVRVKETAPKTVDTAERLTVKIHNGSRFLNLRFVYVRRRVWNLRPRLLQETAGGRPLKSPIQKYLSVCVTAETLTASAFDRFSAQCPVGYARDTN